MIACAWLPHLVWQLACPNRSARATQLVPEDAVPEQAVAAWYIRGVRVPVAAFFLGECSTLPTPCAVLPCEPEPICPFIHD